MQQFILCLLPTIVLLVPTCFSHFFLLLKSNSVASAMMTDFELGEFCMGRRLVCFKLSLLKLAELVGIYGASLDSRVLHQNKQKTAITKTNKQT